MTRVLVIDKLRWELKFLSQALASDKRFDLVQLVRQTDEPVPASDARKSDVLNEAYDVIILDRILPDAGDGLEFLTNLRAQRNETPVLILSGLGEISNRVSGLAAGGDDYLPKPFAFAELLARVEALGRRGKGQAAPNAGPHATRA